MRWIAFLLVSDAIRLEAYIAWRDYFVFSMGAAVSGGSGGTISSVSHGTLVRSSGVKMC